jgi:hypothetical protein
MKRKSIKASITLEWVLAAIFFVLLLFLCVNINFTGDHGDGIMHYLIAKTAPRSPQLFFDLWGKPLFTLVASPFAQLGFQGLHFMNALLAVGTVLIAIATAKKLGLRFSWILFPFIILAPVYFSELYCAMTEPFFAFMLSAIIFLYTDKRFASAAVVTSLLPLARQEGYFLIVALLVIFLMKGRFRFIPHLFIGLVLFSLLGFFFQGDFFILINKHPYTGNDMYGHGDFLHFFRGTEVMLGFHLEILLVAGLLIISNKYFFSLRKNLSLAEGERENYHTEFYLIAGFVVFFYFAHAIMWWKGIFSSYGLYRVFACIVPLIGLIALRALNKITLFFERKFGNPAIIGSLIMFTALSGIILFSRSNFPPAEYKSREEKLLSEAGNWVKENNMNYQKIYFSHPYNVIIYNVNPKEKKDSDELMYVNADQIEENSVVIWDKNFGTQTGWPRQRLASDNNFMLLKTFSEGESEIMVYKKQSLKK